MKEWMILRVKQSLISKMRDSHVLILTKTMIYALINTTYIKFAIKIIENIELISKLFLLLLLRSIVKVANIGQFKTHVHHEWKSRFWVNAHYISLINLPQNVFFSDHILQHGCLLFWKCRLSGDVVFVFFILELCPYVLTHAAASGQSAFILRRRGEITRCRAAMYWLLGFTLTHIYIRII